MIRRHLVFTLLIVGFVSFLETNGQRSPYAGSRPSGYKDRLTGTGSGTTQAGSVDVANRLGESSTSERLPYDAYGDAYLVNHYNQLPDDKKPFWLLNQAHVEAHRGTPGTNGGTVLNSQRPQTAAQANANTNTNNNANTNNVASRFSGADAAPAGRVPNEQDNIYDHNVISHQPVVYPVNIPEEQRQQMEAVVREQQRQAVAQRSNIDQNQNSNSNSNQVQEQQRQVQRSFPVPLAIRERRPPVFQPQSDFPAPQNSFGIAPYFVDYD